MNRTAQPPRDYGHSYDEVPYTAGAILGTHPDDLAMVAVLWGLEPPPIETCRVLELGCASGENLIPMAVAQPEAQFVGIDASARQIDAGRARIADLGLRNVTLLCQLIDSRVPAPGEFDYVLCHGVYSWVGPEVQHQILALCRAALSPNGLAYVSYNTQPGWHMRQQLRDMLLFHTHGQTDAPTRIAQARALLGFLAKALHGRTDLYGRLLLDAAADLAKESDAYVFHEYLEDDNTPMFFFDFAARAGAHGLQYVDEMLARHEGPSLPDDAREVLAAAGPDRVSAEQYLDFVSGRTFRRSILCRRELTPNRADPLVALRRLRCAGAIHALTAEPDLYSAAAEAFQNARGTRLQTNHPAVKTALALLGECYPRSLPFRDLWQTVTQRVAAAGSALPADSERMLGESLHRCHESGFLEYRVSEPPFTTDISERPRASPLARAQAAAGEEVVVSMRHHLVALEPFEQQLVPLLDGTTTRAQLQERLSERTPAGSEPVPEQIEAALRRFARGALLLA